MFYKSTLFHYVYLYTETRNTGLLYYQNITLGSITSHTLVFNNRTMSYELRRILYDNIDYSPTTVELSSWNESFAKFTKTKSNVDSG